MKNSTSPKLAKFQNNVKIEGKSIHCLIDTGCSTNILKLATFCKLQKLKSLHLKNLKLNLSLTALILKQQTFTHLAQLLTSLSKLTHLLNMSSLSQI